MGAKEVLRCFRWSSEKEVLRFVAAANAVHGSCNTVAGVFGVLVSLTSPVFLIGDRMAAVAPTAGLDCTCVASDGVRAGVSFIKRHGGGGSLGDAGAAGERNERGDRSESVTGTNEVPSR